jgi:hypothetical protein
VCLDLVFGPDTRTTPADVDACAAAVAPLDSGPALFHLISEGIPQCAFRGGRAEGQACLYGSQCQSGHCSVEGQCGVCVPAGQLLTKCAYFDDWGNNLAGMSQCDAGLVCNWRPPLSFTTFCSKASELGGPCGTASTTCHWDNLCVDGICVAPPRAGEPCDPNGVPVTCEDYHFCNKLTAVCEPLAVGRAGDPCGYFDDGRLGVCGDPLICAPVDPVAFKGTCAAPTPDGQPCDEDWFFGPCTNPARCINGICTYQDVSLCE